MSKTTITAFLNTYVAPVVTVVLVVMLLIVAHALYQVHAANMAAYTEHMNNLPVVELSPGCALYNDVVTCMPLKSNK